MKTLTVRLPEPLVAEIEAESRVRKVSKSDIVRERLQAASESRAQGPAALDAAGDLEPVLRLMQKYVSLPMSLADACLVRMSETLPDPVILTTDADFRIYRRHSRQIVPCATPFGIP